MDIFEVLNFSFTEFITSPAGIFIVVGILLTIIAIVLLLTDKKSKGAVAPASVPGVVDNNVQPGPVDVQPAVDPMMNQENSVNGPEVAPVANDLGVVNEVAPVENSQPAQMDVVANMPANDPMAMPVQEQPVDNNQELVLNTEPAVNLVMEQTANAIPVVDQVQPVVEPVMEQRQIYGGANPLENTATIPTVQVPYNGAQVVTPEMSMNVQEVVNTPVIDANPVATAAPVVETVPEVAPVQEVVEPVVAPVVEPVVQPVVTPVVEPVQPTVAPVVEQPGPATPVASAPVATDEIETLEF